MRHEKTVFFKNKDEYRKYLFDLNMYGNAKARDEDGKLIHVSLHSEEKVYGKPLIDSLKKYLKKEKTDEQN